MHRIEQSAEERSRLVGGGKGGVSSRSKGKEAGMNTGCGGSKGVSPSLVKALLGQQWKSRFGEITWVCIASWKGF